MTKKTYRDSRGYLRFRDSGRLVHRWAAEKKMRRKLHPGEVVHHSNQIKTDNRRSNLIVLNSRKEHLARHIKQSWENPRYGRRRNRRR
ncbi:MAG: HNH endonuclease [Promethearchaeota archaeon]